jgi:beta-N-acetylglucosaminidase
MKQFRTLISVTLAMILGFTGLVFSGVNGNIDVDAAAIVCNASLPYEVSVISAKDVYTVNACYATLAAAQTAMNTLSASTPNVVVRHPASQSPSKIIAMDRGIAATYGYRTSTAKTVKLFTSYNATTLALGGVDTYTVNHQDMQYLGTMGYNAASGSGVIKIKVSGFVGYIDLKNSDLIPMIYVDNAWLFTLGGPVTSPSAEAPFTMVPKINTYYVATYYYSDVSTGGSKTKTSRDISHVHYSMWDSHSYGSFTYGPAPSWLPNGTYYSWDGINFYTDRDCKHPVYNGAVIGSYYQYFQYLPLRSDTEYTGDEIDNYLETAIGYTVAPTVNPTTGATICPSSCSMLYHQGANFISSQSTYGMNALLVYALAYHESGGGTSALAKGYKNLFGWGAVDSDPSKAAVFASVKQSIEEMMGINLRGYLSPEGWRFFGSVFGSKNSGLNVKYASDLYWGEEIAGRAYTMDRWLGGKDIGAVDYAILNDTQTVNVEKTEGNDTTNLYTLGSSLNDESLILQSNNRIAGKLWARTPTTMPLDANGVPVLYANVYTQLVPYDRTISKGFLITTNYNYQVPRLVDGKTTNLVQTLAWNADKLSVAGYGFVNGYNVSNTSVADYTLKLTGDAGTTSIILAAGAVSEQLTTDFGQNLVSYDGASYNSPSIDVSALAPGTYTLALTLAEDRYGIATDLPFNYAGVLPADTIINGKFYKFQRMTDGSIKMNVAYAIILSTYPLTPTNKDITVSASIAAGWTLNAASHTFSANGSFTFTATDGKGGSVERIVTIDNIDKTPPVITIGDYPTALQDAAITVTATTDEGTLNTASHTFQMNGSFSFIATDAAGNVTTKVVTITNINAKYAVDFAIAQGQGTLSALVDTTVLKTGDLLTPDSTIVFTVVPASGYVVTQWTLNGTAVPNNLTNTLTVPNITASVAVSVNLTMYGDVNNDGKLSTTDIVMLRRYLAGLGTLTDLGKLAGDYNKDGKISTTDIVMMRRKLAGLE